MTILIPMLCRDGLVVAVDSMMSVLSTDGLYQTDITNYPENKISTYNDGKIVVSFSGELGLAQKFRAVVEENSAVESFENYLGFPEKISQQMIHYLNYTRKKSKPEINPALGYVYKNQIYCCHFYDDFRFKFLERGSFYEALGTGATQAFPFTRYLIGMLCPEVPDILPNVDQGTIISYWAIRYAIETSSGGIGKPIRIHVLRKNSKSNTIDSYEINKLEVKDCERYISEAENGIKDWFTKTLENSNFSSAGIKMLPVKE